jgi:hypothetical protein
MLQKISSQFDSIIGNSIKPLLKNQYFFGVIHLFLILYAAKIAPNLPPVLLNLLDNFFVKLLCMFSILLLAKISPMTSLLVALAFLVTMNYVTKGKFIELMRNVERRQQIEALENTDIEIPEIKPEMEVPEMEVPEMEVPEMEWNTIKPITEEADSVIPLVSGCLPDRQIDMSLVSGISSPTSYSAVNF